MESYSNSNKRPREMNQNGDMSIASKRTMRKLDFSMDIGTSPVISKPNKIQYNFNIDENSCGSAFSDHSDTSVNLDNDNEQNNNNSSFGDLSDSPFLISRCRPAKLSLSQQSTTNTNVKHMREKSKSDTFFENAHQIMKALDKACDNSVHTLEEQDNRLVGDLSRRHVLPTLRVSKHRDLASISAQTLVDLIDGRYSEEINEFSILDARYPYEFNGGHITGAESAYLKDGLFEKLFNDAVITSRPKVLIIHCEFSSERGPKLMREIRERDRMINRHSYPNLFYPEIYLLEGGYKLFYEQFSNYCSPQGYLPMLHDNHRNELKYFRKKSKTWEVESRKKTTEVKKTKLSF